MKEESKSTDKIDYIKDKKATRFANTQNGPNKKENIGLISTSLL